MRGDWSRMKQAFNLTGWRGEGTSGEVCWLCSANKTDHDYRRADAAAPWRRQRWTHRAYVRRARREGRFLSCVFQWPGFLLEYVGVDLMHAGDLGHAFAFFQRVQQMQSHRMRSGDC
eukprot:6477331-Pyramimonas_sp.AAC.1